MAYELRVPGRPPAVFDTEEDAVTAARQVLADNPDAEPEVFDTTTGQPGAPAASKAWREELKRRIG